MMLKKIRSLLHQHRKATISLLAVFVCAVGVGLYAFLSVDFWNNYQTSYSHWKQTIQKDTTAALKLPTSSAKERAAKMTALQGVSKDIVAAKETLCRGHSMINWQQQFVATAKSKRETCSKVVDTARKFGLKLTDTINYLKNEQTLSGILAKPIAKQEKITEKGFERQIKLWQTAANDIKKMTVESEFTPIKNKAEKSAQGMKAAWQAVYDAHKAKKQTKYAEAQGKLADAYDTLPAIVSENTRHFAKLAGNLQAAYDDMTS